MSRLPIQCTEEHDINYTTPREVTDYGDEDYTREDVRLYVQPIRPNLDRVERVNRRGLRPPTVNVNRGSSVVRLAEQRTRRVEAQGAHTGRRGHQQKNGTM